MNKLFDYAGMFDQNDYWISLRNHMFNKRSVEFYNRFADDRWVDASVERTEIDRKMEPIRFKGWVRWKGY